MFVPDILIEKLDLKNLEEKNDEEITKIWTEINKGLEFFKTGENYGKLGELLKEENSDLLIKLWLEVHQRNLPGITENVEFMNSIITFREFDEKREIEDSDMELINVGEPHSKMIKMESPDSDDDTIIINTSETSLSLADSDELTVIRDAENSIKAYECKICLKSYVSGDYLKLHIESLHQGVRFKCKECVKLFTTKRSFTRHFASAHGNKELEFEKVVMEINKELENKQDCDQVTSEIRYKCDACNVLFLTKPGLKKHKETLHSGVRFMCSECKRTFKYRMPLLNHIRKNHKDKDVKPEIVHCHNNEDDLEEIENNPENKLQCHLCTKKFRKECERKEHIDTAHFGVRFQCSLCKKIFQSKRAIDCHIRKLHLDMGVTVTKVYPTPETDVKTEVVEFDVGESIEDNGVICDICSASFSSNRTLKKHRRVVHDGYRFKCHGCNQLFNSKAVLQAHIYNFHKEINCEICDLEFTSRDALKDHKSECIEEIKYECELCSDTFKTQSELQSHNLLHHEGLSYKCTKCHQMFESEEYCTEHMTREHQNEAESTEEQITGDSAQLKSNEEFPKLFFCDLCILKFGSKTSLREHKSAIHEGIRFRCAKCKSRYIRKRDCFNHVHKIHQNQFVSVEKCRLDISHPYKKDGRMKIENEHITVLETLTVKGRYLKNKDQQLYVIECDICPEKFRSKSSLREHKLAYHDRVRFQCSSCDSRYIRKRDCVRHVANVHGDEKVKIEKVTLNVSEVELKVFRSENQEDRYECDFCQESFKTRSGHQSHVMVDHEGLRFKCSKCLQVFTTEKNCESHLLRDHKDETDGLVKRIIVDVNVVKAEEASAKVFPCDLCNERFVSKTAVREHKEGYHERIRFKCSRCESRYMRKRDCAKHIKTHKDPNVEIRKITLEATEDDLRNRSLNQIDRFKEVENALVKMEPHDFIFLEM